MDVMLFNWNLYSGDNVSVWLRIYVCLWWFVSVHLCIHVNIHVLECSRTLTGINTVSKQKRPRNSNMVLRCLSFRCATNIGFSGKFSVFSKVTPFCILTCIIYSFQKHLWCVRIYVRIGSKPRCYSVWILDLKAKGLTHG